MSETISGLKRTHYCAALSEHDAGTKAVVMGWVQRSRNLGGLIFTDIRDRTGIIQCVFDQTNNAALFEKAATLRSEYTICAVGNVRMRAGTPNTKIPTGTIEILADDLRIFAKSETPPFEIVENSDVNDVLRLKYRYLDLRRPDMQRIMMLRHRISQVARRYFDENDFLEIETPILTKSTPEGARDYLVPSRVFPGKFFALPQSPQQYKQLLMLAGFDRYFQLARCMRDEDLRADRQPEFTQIDLEMSFVDADDVMEMTEKFMQRLFKEVLNVDVALPLRRITYAEAMERYGSDKPDLRFAYELVNLSDVVADCGFKVFDGALSDGGAVRAIKIDGGAAKFTRKEIDSLAEYAKTYRAGGLAWVRMINGDKTSSFAKFLPAETFDALIARMDAHDGDVILAVADKNPKVVFDALGALRCECARRMGAITPGEILFKFAWVTEFPLYEYDEEERRLVAMHHPFTAPMDEDVALLDTNPIAVRAKAYDIVLNGYELGGGSIRIHSSELQQKMFSIMGFSDEQIASRFGHLVEAFKYGAPPHGGLALGLDRVVMLMAGRDNMRDVIAFPKVQNSSELMMSSPDIVDEKQLTELGISLLPQSKS